MTPLEIILAVILAIIVIAGLLGEGKRSSLDTKIMELKAENYSLSQENTKLKADNSHLKATWCSMKSKLPMNIDKKIGQGKSLGETSS
jgi:outer membrane murein-binding lipoprotein Lpp